MSQNTLTIEETKINEFLLARGGPFYALQKQLGLLREDAFRAVPRAVLFVGLAWGVPLLLSLVAGNAVGPRTESPYLFELGVWARFFIAVGLFMLMERKVEERLRSHLVQFARAPLLAPESFAAAAEAVTKALKQRDSRLAELICLLIAVAVSIVMVLRFFNEEASSWVVRVTAEGAALTLAGWWSALVSNTIFMFLLLRWLWRLQVWANLLRRIANLELRLVSTHPDGHGGLAFLGQYPNAYATFVFAISCVLGAAIAHELLSEALSATTYGYVMTGWFVIVLALFVYPLLAFRRPLLKLKVQTLMVCSSQATRHHRAVERELLGRNISAAEDAEPTPASEIPDPSKELTAARKLSGLLFDREGLLPISAAAITPLFAAGATQLPIKEIATVLKRLLLL